MVRRKVTFCARVERRALLLGVGVCLAACASADTSIDELPAATRERISTIIREMDRTIGGHFEPVWSASARSEISREISRAGEPPDHLWLTYGDFYALLSLDGTEIRGVGHRHFSDGNPLPHYAVTSSEAHDRAVGFMSALEPGWTFDVIGVVDRRNYWYVWMRPLHHGLPFGNFGAQCWVPVSKYTGRVLDYTPLSAPVPDDSCRVLVRPYDAQTAAGLALAERPGPSTWHLGQARLVWMYPGGGPEAVRWNDRYERWKREGMAGLFYEVWGSESDQTNQDGSIRGRTGPVYVDAETGEAAMIWPTDGALLGRGPAPRRTPRGLDFGPASVSFGARRVEAYRAAIWWVAGKAKPTGVEVRIVAPGRAMRAFYDAGKRRLIDPDTGATGLPSPSLRRALDALGEDG